MLALKAGSNGRGQTTQNGSVGVNKAPVALVIRLSGTVGIFFHFLRTPKFNESGMFKQFYNMCQEKNAIIYFYNFV
jgi:hypothetical protein